MAKKVGTEDVSFPFVETVKKQHKKDEVDLECFNGLCKSKKNCRWFQYDKEGIYRINRITCRIYEPKEKAYVSKSKGF